MDYFTTNKFGRIFVLRLDKGDDILDSIKSLSQKENIKNAAVTSGIGTVDNCVLHFVTDINDASKMYFKKWNDTALEVAAIQGLIANGDPHLHAVVSNDKESWAGHLEPGCTTLFLCEILIVELENLELAREPKTTDETDTDYYVKQLVKIIK